MEKALDVQAAGVRGRLLAELEKEWQSVVRVLVTDPITNGNARVLLEAMNQALGRPTEHVEVAAADPLRETLQSLTPEERRELLLSMNRKPEAAAG